MTSRQRSDLVRYLACYAVACLAWEAMGLAESGRQYAVNEVTALRTYRIPVADALMAFMTEAPHRAGLSIAIGTALALACLAAFSTIAKGRAATSILAVLVGLYAVTGIPASVAVSGLLLWFMGETPMLPYDMPIPNVIGPDPGNWSSGDIMDLLEAFVSLGIFVAWALAILAAVALLWANIRGGASPTVRRFVVPTSMAPAVIPVRGGIRTSGG